MGRLSISETQFAFTYFHKFAQLQRADWYDFVFPTLGQEGDPTGDFAGADVVISKNLFIQFKVPDILWTENTNEFNNYQTYRMTAPYFRNHIKNTLLSGKPNSGQYDMLKRVAASGRMALYIFPVFNFSIENDDASHGDYWFKNFFGMAPSMALNRYCLSVDFNDLSHPQFNIGNTDSHTICYDYNLAMNIGEVLFFSEPKNVKCSKFIQSFRTTENTVTWQDEKTQSSIEQTITEIKTLIQSEKTNSNDLSEINSISQLQTYLLAVYDIFWLPIIKDKKEERNIKIERVLTNV